MMTLNTKYRMYRSDRVVDWVVTALLFVALISAVIVVGALVIL